MDDVLVARRVKSSAPMFSPSAPSSELPASVVVGAIKYAQAVQGTSHLIAQDDVFRQIYDKMGWEHESDMD